MADLRTMLRDLSREIDRLAGRNDFLEKRLQAITGALHSAVGAPRRGRPPARRTGGKQGRRGAPSKFSDAQALQLRKEYEKGATGAELAKRHGAALPTILSTLRRVGTPLRRGRRKKR